MKVLSSAALALIPLTVLSLAGCSSSNDPVPSPSPTPAQTLSGIVQGSGAAGLAGAKISALGGTVLATTDSSGAFVLYGPLPNGPVRVHVDGTTVAGGPWPEIDVSATLGGVDSVVSQHIVLPNLGNGVSANANTDASGATLAAIALDTGAGLSLLGDSGTVIALDGLPAASTSVPLNVTAVPRGEISAPLPDGLVSVSVATVQPPNASFDDDGDGLDLTLPNPLGVPLGQLMDVWALEEGATAWVNRSQETGLRAIVDTTGTGTYIGVPDMVTRGGLYAVVLPVCDTCTYELTGHVVRAFAPGGGIPGATVALDTGQFAVTDANGDFTISKVAAYDLADALLVPPVATLTPLDWTVVTPVAYGGESLTDTLTAGAAIPGGQANLSLKFLTDYRGVVVGRAVGGGVAGGAASVVLAPLGGQPSAGAVIPEDDGSFFFAKTLSGEYSLSYAFPSDPNTAVLTGVTVGPAQISAAILSEGAPAQGVDVLVLFDSDGDLGTPAVPHAGARVTLAGSGGTGGARTTNALGIARFLEATGPFTVTAQVDIDLNGSGSRLASTVVGLMPQNGVISVPVLGEAPQSVLTHNATLEVVIQNAQLTTDESLNLYVYSHGVEAGDSLVLEMIGITEGTTDVFVPSGTVLTGIVTVVSNAGPADYQAARMVMAPDFGPLAHGTMATRTFDFTGTDVVAIDIAIPVEFGGAVPGATKTRASLSMDSAAGFEGYLPLALFDATPTNNTLSVPDFSAGQLASLGLGLAIDSDEGSTESSCDLSFTATPTDATFNLLSPAQLTSPTEGLTISASDAEQMTISATGAAGDEPAPGTGGALNFVFIEGPTKLYPGIDEIAWMIWLPSSAESVALPATSWKMFAESTPNVAFDRFRYTGGVVLDYATFFDIDLAAKLVSLDGSFLEECSASAFVGIEVTQPVVSSVTESQPGAGVTNP